MIEMTRSELGRGGGLRREGMLTVNEILDSAYSSR
jgi:hypothetical protein